MSADPKSLATLAISTSSKTPKPPKHLQQATTQPSNNDDKSNDCIRPDNVKKFRSTDEFIAGWSAACINTTILFPVNKLIFRQMAGGYGAYVAADQMKEEGLRYLYRGILPPLIQKMVSISIMFGSFGHYKKWADSKFTSFPPLVNLALASCLTGATEAVLTPLERVQMLLQDRKFHKNYKNTVDALVKLRQFGSREYYRGLTCVLLRNGPSNILFFGLRDEIKKLIPRMELLSSSSSQKNIPQPTNNNDNLSTSTRDSSRQQQQQPKNNSVRLGQVHLTDSMLHDFLSGAILGMCISTLFYPLSVVRTRMQTRAPGTEFLSIVKAFNAVYSERDKKFLRLFRGCTINVMRQFMSWGIINCSYEFVLDLLHEID